MSWFSLPFGWSTYPLQTWRSLDAYRLDMAMSEMARQMEQAMFRGAWSEQATRIIGLSEI
jgi:hypothetical protein